MIFSQNRKASKPNISKKKDKNMKIYDIAIILSQAYVATSYAFTHTNNSRRVIAPSHLKTGTQLFYLKDESATHVAFSQELLKSGVSSNEKTDDHPLITQQGVPKESRTTQSKI